MLPGVLNPDLGAGCCPLAVPYSPRAGMKNQTFTSLDFGSSMAPQEGCSVWSRTAKQAAFPLQDARSSLAGVTNDQPPRLCCACKCVFWSAGLLCATPLQDQVTGLPPSHPPVLPLHNLQCPGLVIHLRGNFLLSWTQLSGGETDLASNKVLFSRGEGNFTGQSLLPCKGQVVENCPLSVQHREILKSPQKSWGFVFFILNTTFLDVLSDCLPALTLSATECIAPSYGEAEAETSRQYTPSAGAQGGPGQLTKESRDNKASIVSDYLPPRSTSLAPASSPSPTLPAPCLTPRRRRWHQL